MLTIKNSSHGHKVTFSPGIPGERGFTIVIGSTERLHNAIDHWFCNEIGKTDNCPLCEWVERETKNAGH